MVAGRPPAAGCGGCRIGRADIERVRRAGGLRVGRPPIMPEVAARRGGIRHWAVRCRLVAAAGCRLRATLRPPGTAARRSTGVNAFTKAGLRPKTSSPAARWQTLRAENRQQQRGQERVMTTSCVQVPPATEPQVASPASLARAAMLHLAQRRIPPTPSNYQRAWVAVGGPDAVPSPEFDLEMRRAARLNVELTELVRALCDTVTALADDDRWVGGQMAALRELLAGDLEYVSVAEVRGLLGQAAKLQRGIAEQRRAAMAQLKATLVELMALMGGVLDSTDRFGDRINAHAAEIGAVSTLTGLSTTVQRLLEDARDMKSMVDTSRTGLQRSQENADALAREVARLEEQLASASAEVTTDHLTRAMNRRGLDLAYRDMRAQATQSGRSMSLSLIDVDNFKKLNDALGHHAGDDALKQLAQVLKDRLRPNDVVARYGGEEFVILLAGADVAIAQQAMVRVQRELTAHVFMDHPEHRFITFSAGVTEVRPEDALEDAVLRADTAMYRAKRDGKNCVRAG